MLLEGYRQRNNSYCMLLVGYREKQLYAVGRIERETTVCHSM